LRKHTFSSPFVPAAIVVETRERKNEEKKNWGGVAGRGAQGEEKREESESESEE
jgi:hypothetical protein